MSSPIAFDDTQFDLDLSDHLDQYPAGPGAVPAGPTRFEAVLPVGDPWGAPAGASTSVAPDPETAPVDQPEPELADEPAHVTDVDAEASASDEPLPADGPGPALAMAAPAEPVTFAATTVEDVPVPWVPAEGGTATWADALARAVDPPTSVHSVFAVTPPQGTPAVVVAPAPSVPPPPVASPKAARRRRRGVAVLAAVLALGLVAGGAGLAIATNDGGDDGDVAVADAPGQSVALPPAGAEADKPDDAPESAAAPAPGDTALPDAGDPADLDRAVGTVTTFLAVRGTDEERAVSSQGGRAEVDAAAATIGWAVAQGDPTCSAGADAGTFTCVLDTDQGPFTFTIGPDADDPQTSGFEVIGASVG